MTAVSVLLFIVLFLSPIGILMLTDKLKIKYKLPISVITALIVTFMIALVVAWWNYASAKMLLNHYGAYIFNMDSNAYQVRYDNVSPENVERVKRFEVSIMGIGWPLKGIMASVFYFPYVLTVAALK